MATLTAPTPTRTRKPQPSVPSLWTYYKVRWEFLTRLCGQVPADPELVQKFLESRKPSVKPAGGRSIQEINEEVVSTLEREFAESDEQFNVLQFQRQNGVCVFRHGTIKAHIKDCGRQLSTLLIGKIQGEKSFAVRVVNGVYPDEHQYWVPVLRPDGMPVLGADGAFDKAARAMTPRGVVSFLKRIEYIEPPSVMEFTLKVLGKCIKEDDLHTLFQYGGTHGYAGERGDGEGRYSYELSRIEP